MLEHRRLHFRHVDRGYTDCDQKWRCVDVHEDKIIQIGDVTIFAALLSASQ